jgi:hypothetical protein
MNTFKEQYERTKNETVEARAKRVSMLEKLALDIKETLPHMKVDLRTNEFSVLVIYKTEQETERVGKEDVTTDVDYYIRLNFYEQLDADTEERVGKWNLYYNSSSRSVYSLAHRDVGHFSSFPAAVEELTKQLVEIGLTNN